MPCMKHIGSIHCRSAVVLLGFALAGASALCGQSAARVEGHATDAAGRPVAHPVIRLVSDPTSHAGSRPWRYTLIGDSLGKYSQEGIAPGAYLVMLFTDGKGTSVLKNISLRAGDDSVVNFTVTTPVQIAGASGSEPGEHGSRKGQTQSR